MSNIVKAVFGGTKTTRTSSLWQYDYGQILQFVGVKDLPETYEVHFANSETGTAKIQVGDENGVDIPDEYLATGLTVYAWLFLHTGASDGETKYLARIPVKKRAKPSDEEITPEQQSAITKAIELLQTATEQMQEYMNAQIDISVEDHVLVIKEVE